MEKNLYLNLKRKWFTLILSGKKTVEFRQYKDFWIKRLTNKDGTIRRFEHVFMKSGYSVKSPSLWIRIAKISIIDHICWGKVFAIELKGKPECYT